MSASIQYNSSYQDNKDGAKFSFEIIEIESREEDEDDDSRHQIIDEVPT